MTPRQIVETYMSARESKAKHQWPTMSYRGMHHMVQLFLFTFLALSSGPAYAEWVQVSEGEEAGKTTYMDPATKRRNSNLVQIWQFSDYRTVQTVGGVRFLSAKEKWEFDCAEARSRVIELKEFSGNMGSGTVVFTNSEVGKWIPIIPGSIGQTVWKVVCKKD